MTYSWIFTSIGVVIVAGAMLDFYITTITFGGSGPLSRWLSRQVWRSALSLHHRIRSHRLLASTGPVIIFGLIVAWFSLCWLGWLLFFCGSEAMIVNSETKTSANLIERIYYTGYTLTTIGYGDFVADTSPARIASIICGFNGLFLVTLAITYSMPLVSNAVEKRQLSVQIATMGRSSADIIQRGSGDDASFQYLRQQLQQLEGQIARISETHLAYPVLHYFHASYPRGALALNLIRLDEAITIILKSYALNHTTRTQFETSQYIISVFMNTLENNFIQVQQHIPPAPECNHLAALQNATTAWPRVKTQMEQDKRRALLLAYAQADGWNWEEVHGGTGDGG